MIQPMLLYILCSKCAYTSCTRLPCIPDEKSDSQIHPTNAWFLHHMQVGHGADRFLDEWARRTNGVRTQHVNGNFLSEPQTRSSTVDPLDQDIPLHNPRTSRTARMWATVDFVPAHLQSAIPFWRDIILPATIEADRDTLLGWIRGVSVHDFVDSRAQGTFQGHQYSGPDLTSVHLPNHVPAEHCSWVTAEVEQLVSTGCIARWADVADTSLYTKPHMVLPLGVEPKKPRLIWDARWLNLMCVHSPFTMDRVGKVAQYAWPGAHQVTVDHKSAYHHVALEPSSWQYFGFEWEDEFYVFTVLCFGWCSAPFIYASLSEAAARYLRSQDVPVLTWIDDFYVTNFCSTRLLEPNQRFVAAQAAASLVLDVLYQAEYFISISKCELTPSTRLVFLGITCDTVQCRFEAPADKLEKLEHMLSDAVTSGAITFQMLEKLAGKCTSFSVAVPVAA